MDSGKRNEERSSALWGTGGNRGGETRSSALWGKGGRGFVTALVAMLAVSVPLASSSDGHQKSHASKAGAVAHRSSVSAFRRTYIAPVLEKQARKRPDSKLSVIIQANSRFVLNNQVRTVFARS